MTKYYENVICFEGNAGSGKTTYGEAMAQLTGGVFFREYTETLASEHLEFLMNSYEWNTNDNESDIWIQAEARRIDGLPFDSTRVIVLDTSFVSVIGFGCARLEFGQGGNIAATIRAYRDLIADDRLILPKKIMHLRVSEIIRKTRIAKRGNCHPFLARTDVSKYLDEFRIYLFEKYLPPECWTSIDTSDLTLNVAMDTIKTKATSLKNEQLSDFFAAWLVDIEKKYS